MTAADPGLMGSKGMLTFATKKLSTGTLIQKKKKKVLNRSIFENVASAFVRTLMPLMPLFGRPLALH